MLRCTVYDSGGTYGGGAGSGRLGEGGREEGRNLLSERSVPAFPGICSLLLNPPFRFLGMQ